MITLLIVTCVNKRTSKKTIVRSHESVKTVGQRKQIRNDVNTDGLDYPNTAAN